MNSWVVVCIAFELLKPESRIFSISVKMKSLQAANLRSPDLRDRRGVFFDFDEVHYFSSCEHAVTGK